ncbi:MAG: penicillin-binding protein [Kordiimonas sp.]|nr:penicillin-binding protein [Kordiimonas sp.]
MSGRVHGHISIEGEKKTAIDVARTRMMIAMTLFAIGFGVLGVRVVDLGMLQKVVEPRQRVIARHNAFTGRADVVDRHGRVLATNLATPSLYVNPRQVMDPMEAAQKLQAVLPELKFRDLLSKMKSGRHFVWIKRKLTPEQQWKVNRLGLPGLHFQYEEERFYPQGDLLAHVLGYVDVDGKGLAGIERYYDERLADPALMADPLVLTIDLRVQNIVAMELAKTMQLFSARGAAGLVMDVQTGEVLSLVSLPSFDPQKPGTATKDAKFNRAVQGVYELGSGFKAFTVAMALEHDVVDLEGGYDATEPLKVARFTINDDHAKERWLSVPEIFAYSSNIGTAKMAVDVGGDKQRDFLQKMGLFNRSDIELPEAAHPILPRQWGEVETMTIGYGHGLAVSPLHLVEGISALSNGGRHISATLIRDEGVDDREARGFSAGEQLTRYLAISQDSTAAQVISEKTSKTMRQLLRLAVQHGTGSMADVDGYRVGGKTGTAEKASAGGYRRKDLLSSFVGVFPVDRPRYAVMAVFDEPRGREETFWNASGGWTAAPTVGEIVRKIGPLLGIAPREERENPLRQAMLIED